MSNVILGIVFVVSLVLYVMRRRARLQVEDGDNY
jgi:hypothetical protein